MDVYRKLNLKYSNRCKKCGTRLEVGVMANGRKGLSGKWEFLCNDCISELPEAAEITPTTIEPEKLTEVLKHAKEILPGEFDAALKTASEAETVEDFLDVIEKTPLKGVLSETISEAISDDDPVSDKEPDPTTLEGIMGGARWKL
jgi:hypothetical protein